MIDIDNINLEINNVEVGKRLKEYQEKRSYKNQMVADYLELTLDGYKKIRNGNVRLGVKHAFKLAALYSVTIGQIYFGKDEVVILESSDLDYIVFLDKAMDEINSLPKDKLYDAYTELSAREKLIVKKISENE